MQKICNAGVTKSRRCDIFKEAMSSAKDGPEPDALCLHKSRWLWFIFHKANARDRAGAKRKRGSHREVRKENSDYEKRLPGEIIFSSLRYLGILRDDV